ncbi:MAG: GNAT family N-acetyltransferase [Alphaproteobacteria bacterium]|nr:GNAT family N-acetyltransferase [Alphaproteobacteria bacterium]
MTRSAAPPDVTLVRFSRARLPRYVDALEQGWSPDNIRGAVAAREQLDAIAKDPDAFVWRSDDPEGRLPPIQGLDGVLYARLPGVTRWIWDDDFCGVISLRWDHDRTGVLPPHVLGHIGYAVVPWKRGLGRARQALKLILPVAWARSLPFVELTTQPDNLASQKVILANGGVLVERFAKPTSMGGGESLRFRIRRPAGA